MSRQISETILHTQRVQEKFLKNIQIANGSLSFGQLTLTTSIGFEAIAPASPATPLALKKKMNITFIYPIIDNKIMP